MAWFPESFESVSAPIGPAARFAKTGAGMTATTGVAIFVGANAARETSPSADCDVTLKLAATTARVTCGAESLGAGGNRSTGGTVFGGKVSVGVRGVLV